MNKKKNKVTGLNRRDFIKAVSAAGVFYWLGPKLMIGGKAYAAAGGPPLDPTDITKYITPLVIPPAMPRTSVISPGIDYYEIAIRQFQQQILPIGKPPTIVWSYGSVNHRDTFNYPAFTIEATFNKPVRVKWINQLVDTSGNYLPHLLPVDPTLHWANPPGPIDTRPTFSTTPDRYNGPVPMVTHLHGGRTAFDSDGYAEAWYLPKATYTSGYSRKGTRYASPYGTPDDYWQGFAVFQYANAQRASTLWYHDHTLGMTRLNVYAGPAGFYLLRGGPDDLPSGLPVAPYEIPIAIQDRSFNADGSLFYPDSRAFFDGYAGLYIPTTPVSPIWNPEFFGDTIVVNGNTWPKLNVQKRRYRFRFLNGTQARTLILKMVTNATARPGVTVLPFWLIGTEGGFLPAPVQLDQLLMVNAERSDVIVDFTSVPVGTDIYLINEGPDGPFNGEIPPVEPPIANPATTGQVMKLTVVPITGTDTSVPPHSLSLPTFVGLGAAANTRQVALFEEAYDAPVLGEIPVEVLLGTPADGKLMWADAITETPPLGATEVWEIYNRTIDAHPIHIHEVLFQVVNRQAFTATEDPVTGVLTNIALVGPPRLPGPQESGYKDTALALPGEVTRVKAKFENVNRYVWHCHIVEHEDNEMMRPYFVTQNPSVDLGAALGYPLLGLTGAKISMSDKKSGIVGNVGLGPNGEQNFADGFITGTFFVDQTAKNSKSNKVVITGGTIPRALYQAEDDAFMASAQAAAKLPTQVIGEIKKPQTIVGGNGLNVIQIDSIDLKDGALTLSGDAKAEFIINIFGKGKLKLSGGSKIQLAGGLLPSNVLFNLPDSGEDVALSGGSQAAGTFLAPKRKVALSGPSMITGSVIAGGDIALSGGSVIRLVG